MKNKSNIILLHSLVLFFSMSCSKKDETYVDLKKTPDNELSKICFQNLFDSDTVKSNELSFKIPIKNCGKNTIKKFKIVTTCDCTSISKAPKELKANETYNLELKIDLKGEKGYYKKQILLYGTFFPYVKYINFEGYKK